MIFNSYYIKFTWSDLAYYRNMFSIKLSVLFLQLLASDIASDIMYSADQSTECINKKIKERSRFNDPYVRVLNFNLKNVY